MNKIETLLKELCPNGVEWCELWEETVWDKKFNSVENYKQAEVDKYRYLLASDATKIIQEVGEIKILTTNKSDIFTTNEFVEEFYDEEIIAIPWGGNPIVQYYKGKFVTADNRIARVKDKNRLNTKFLYYYLTNNLTLISTFYRGSGIKHPNMLKVLSLKIPIPPLEIQEEIVKILDKFTDYVTELTTELTLRQKQYHYYRDMLLSFEDEFYQVKWKCLEDLCDVRDGTHDSPIKQNSGKLLITSKNIKNGCVSYKDAYYISQEDFNSINVRSKVDKNDILFTMIGTVGEIAHVTSEPDYAIKNVGLIKTGNKVFARYLFHYLQSSLAKKYIEDNKSKGSQVFLALGKIRKFPIPYIDTKIQSRIVQVLDNFDAVCNDLNIGLPKEIELRQKQYEFFRDKLLTFAAEGVYTDSTVQTRHN